MMPVLMPSLPGVGIVGVEPGTGFLHSWGGRKWDGFGDWEWILVIESQDGFEDWEQILVIESWNGFEALGMDFGHLIMG